MKIRRLSVVLAVLLGCCVVATGSTARADLTDPAIYNFNTSGFFANDTFGVAKFDSSLGTLTSVQVDFSYQISGVTFSLENISSSPKSVEIQQFENQVLYFAGSSISNPYQNLGLGGTVNLAAFDGTSDFSGPDSATIAQTLRDSGSRTDMDSNLEYYEGLGTAAFQIIATTVFSYGSTGSPDDIVNNSATNLTGTLSGTVTITYGYTPAAVPEPSSLAMAALGLASVAGRQWWRARRVAGFASL